MRSAQRLRAGIHDAVSAAADGTQFRENVMDVLGAFVPYDGGCLAPVDPAVVVPTGFTTRGLDDPIEVLRLSIEIEYGPDPDPDSLYVLLHRPSGIRRVGEPDGDGTGQGNRRYLELVSQLGMGHELQLVFRDGDRRCWGVGELMREPGRGFTDAELAMLDDVLGDIANGFRTTLIRDASAQALMRDASARVRHSEVADGCPGPAVVVIGADDDFDSVTAAAAVWFERLGWGSPVRGRPGPAHVVARQVRRTRPTPATVRLRTLDGEWVVLRAAILDGTGRVVMTFERARLPEIVTLVTAAYGLTPRESEVLVEVLAGRSRNEIASRLFISPYTVQDHLKNIFTKTGVNSRRSLVSRLACTEYMPRFGGDLRPDGWFDESGTRTAPVEARTLG
ncbi:helix-turn-helix transcriptional regulator [Rhodococcus rhodochrous]|uniref:helix-turn-helix transcriptional regulator n=1 Tax=Rhodococcus rhodochrous TaxID=1829 RepID=UPI00132F17FA|nr:helix-turn-helix transcriptional regulator [Rhodococcus rhodochrous]QHG81495.1 LuxR family transcriptional regulator [Rhodococcus rhodochrous]QOH58829.1 LuxR family transcriptional regulator [Rhodococcus rhodochrous]